MYCIKTKAHDIKIKCQFTYNKATIITQENKVNMVIFINELKYIQL